MNLKIENKIIIITGGAEGIGKAITRCVAAEGGIPVIIGRSK
ncbi:MAG: short-chain dehydrogenase, partial [Candidatus Marinimicrobia bacterium]|nr:short-chain dehydrogenase [Candidatus Neomarinimicrobiota bacterium]